MHVCYVSYFISARAINRKKMKALKVCRNFEVLSGKIGEIVVKLDNSKVMNSSIKFSHKI